MYYLRGELRAMFLANYAREVERGEAKVRGMFSYEKTRIRYCENEVASSLRHHSDAIHARAVERAARRTAEQVRRGSDPGRVAGGADLDAAAAEFGRRTERMADPERRDQVRALAGEYAVAACDDGNEPAPWWADTGPARG